MIQAVMNEQVEDTLFCENSESGSADLSVGEAADSDSRERFLEDARELYLKYRGVRHHLIVREMRERGWRFHRNMLYTRKRADGDVKGLPELYGWRELLAAQESSRQRVPNFDVWLKQTFPEWKWSWNYQRYVYTRLNRLTTGRSDRLMIFMPPRHGKSELVTIRYTAWRLLQDPKMNVIIGSYNQRLANKFSRRVKRIVDGTAGVAELADGGIDPPFIRRAASVSEWETPGGGVVRAAGVGAGIAGFGAGLVVIDDPVRSRADAESATFRDKVFDWFNDDVYTRLEPKASIVLIQTRWHEDDLAGRLLREQEDGGEKWDVISLPAIAEENDAIGRKPGAALCPARYNIKALEKTRRKLGSYSFSSLYQQNPVPATGGTFKRAWFRNIVESAPPKLRWVRGYDLAISTSTTADFTASFRCAYDAAGNLYIADGFRRKIEYPDQRRYIIERMAEEDSTEHCIEAALHGKALVQDLRSDPSARRYALREVQVDTDKLTRALAWLNLAEAGKLFLVRGPWIDNFVDEVCRFPSGKHDDQVDAVSVAVSRLGVSTGNRAWGF